MAATRSNVVGTSNYRGGALREDLANFISNISRDETPFLSSLGSVKAKLPRHEWQLDTLDNPAANAQSGSFEFATGNNSDVTTTRISNYTQVFGKTVHIEGSLLKSDPAGAANWFAYTMKKRGREMKRDVERRALIYKHFTVDDDVVYNAGATTTAREMGAFAAYTANFVRAAATTVELNGTSGNGNAVTTTAEVGFNVHGNANYTYGANVLQYTADPTDVQLTQAHITSLMKTMFDNGGKPTAAQVPSGLKTRVSELLIAGNGGAAQRRASEMSKKVNLAVDAVMTDFGFDISIIPNYIMENHAEDASAAVYFYDPAMVKIANMTDTTVEEDGTARYGKGAIMFCEKSIEYRNPNSQGMIIGVKASS